MVTGPYHTIASLYGVMPIHNILRERVSKSKTAVIKKWNDIVRKGNQPLLCTYIEGEVIPNDKKIVLYKPRSKLTGSVICHFGEIFHDKLEILERITVKAN